MKKAYALIIIFCSVFGSNISAQLYGNEWIRSGQSYYKLKITREGIYRVDSLYLRNAGIPQSWVTNTIKLQLFHNGVEQYIYIRDGNQDGILNQNDFIEFYADRNDGSFDSQLYIDLNGNPDPNLQPNPHYSLFNDTAIYFLTLTTGLANGLRVTEINNDTLNFSQTAEPYFTREVFMENTQQYNTGTIDLSSGTDMDYIEAEGWVDAFISWSVTSSANSTVNKTVSTQNIYNAVGSPDATYKTVVVGANNNRKNLLIDITGSNVNLVSNDFYGYAKKEYSGTIQLVDLGATTTNFRYKLIVPPWPDDTQTGYAAFSYLELRYPHTFDFNGENVSSYKLFVPDAASFPKSHLHFTNFNFNGNHIFYDLTNHRRLTGVQQGNQMDIHVPNAGGEKLCYLTGIGNILSPAGIAPVSSMFAGTLPTQFTNFSSGTIASDSAFIIISGPSLWNSALSYQAYRNLRFNTLLVDINELYDQFAYGIRKHPLAIKNFARYMLNVWTAPPLNKAAPAYIFMIGKGYSPVDMRVDASLHNSCIVPSMGYPSSDNLLTSGNGFPGTHHFRPSIAIGRLAAQNAAQVDVYLHKVQEYEGAQNIIPPPPWMKEILHFGGGDDIWLQNQIRSYLDNYETIAEGCNFGGHVTSYYKNSSNVIQQNQSDTLQQQIDNGVCLMTFFGHAAASVGFDIATDLPSNYGNHGKYPLIIANSCFAGDIFTPSVSVSEQFVLEPEKGAIAFLASVGLGSIAHLYMYTVNFYRAFSDTLYGGSFGNCIQYAVGEIDSTYDQAIKRVCLEMTLHGDPALRMPGWNKADLEIQQPDIFFSPDPVTTQLDSFSVHVLVHNRGLGVCETDSFNVNIKRTFPNGTDTTYIIRNAGCLYSDTVTVNIPMDFSRSAGLNTFDVYVDSLSINEVPEFIEVTNNRASAPLFIISSEIYPIYPFKYAIYPYSTVTLKASTANAFAGTRTYVFEIDTTDLFNTPNPQVHKQGFVTSSGGVVSWADNLPVLQDSMVYFWRVALDSVLTDPVNYRWNESSFIYIPAKTGWSQAHFFQFKNDRYETIDYDRQNRRFDYGPVSRLLTCNTGWPYNANYLIDNVLQDEGTCNSLSAKINIAVIDTLTLDPWTTDTCVFGYHGQLNWNDCNGNSTCLGHPQPYKYFQYDLTDNNQVNSLINLLNNGVPNGYYILAFTFNTYPLSLIPAWPQLQSAFDSLGSSMILTIPDNRAFIFFVKKGSPSTVIETAAVNNLDTISINAPLITKWYKGNIISEVIGPAVQWNSLHWKQNPIESPTTRDSIHLQVYGVLNTGVDTLLIDRITTGAYDTTLSFISTAQYPRLRLKAVTRDDSLRTPPQLKRWQIYYSEAPEAAINPNRHFQFHSNPITEGDSISFSVAIENIGTLPMDSMGVDYYMYDNNRNYYNLKSYKGDSLRLGQYIIADMKYPVPFGWAGANSLWVEANPFNATHQTEQYHFNNYGVINLKVDRDLTNPILDVTFDGVHILDGDVVSAKPHIMVRLNDENKFLALNDTSAFTFFLKTPTSASLPLYFVNAASQTDNMRFTPAILPKNSCRIEWDPNFTEDGIYELIIQGRDRSLNYSGAVQYKITFEVINRSTITNVLNYPNPFSTSTRFVFTLTGSVIPDYFKIQILTISGKVVREITREELGNIHVGRNITDYAWNGKDEFGDQLANGVYLYRVITRINGSEIEKRETDADSFFKQGWGKMYLMR